MQGDIYFYTRVLVCNLHCLFFLFGREQNDDLINGAVGVVLRDSNVKLTAAGTDKLNWCGGALTAEAHALCLGLKFAMTTGCNKIEINSDNIENDEGGRSFGAAVAIF